MESVWYNVSEAIICFVPVFLIIAFIGVALLWNSLPSQTKQKPQAEDEE